MTERSEPQCGTLVGRKIEYEPGAWIIHEVRDDDGRTTHQRWRRGQRLAHREAVGKLEKSASPGGAIPKEDSFPATLCCQWSLRKSNPNRRCTMTFRRFEIKFLKINFK